MIGYIEDVWTNILPFTHLKEQLAVPCLSKYHKTMMDNKKTITNYESFVEACKERRIYDIYCHIKTLINISRVFSQLCKYGLIDLVKWIQCKRGCLTVYDGIVKAINYKHYEIVEFLFNLIELTSSEKGHCLDILIKHREYKLVDMFSRGVKYRCFHGNIMNEVDQKLLEILLKNKSICCHPNNRYN